MTDKITCKGCQKLKKIPPTSNVGEMMSQSGYKAVMLSDTTILWICPECVDSLKPHIQAIADALGSSSLHWPHVLMLIEPSKPGRKQDGQKAKTEEAPPTKLDPGSILASATHVVPFGDCEPTTPATPTRAPRVLVETETDAPGTVAAYSKMRSYDAGKAEDHGNKTLPMRREKR
jgi:hypothetical protein